MIRKVRSFLGRQYTILLCRISCKIASKRLYRKKFNKEINLDNPQTFNEKLMKLKLENYNNNEQVFLCSDKYCVRNYAISCGVDKKNLPPIIKVYDDARDINLSELPNKFVLKCSHGYGFNIVCKDKQKLNLKEAIKKLNKWKKTKFGYASCEVHYTHVKPTIFAEEYIEGKDGKFPDDYKLYCFNGVPNLVLVCSEREKELRLNFFDLEWNELKKIGVANYRNEIVPKKPKHLDEMISIAKNVSKEFPFVRVDFYEYEDKVYMGEMTFTPACCVANYYTEYGDKYLGSLLKIGDYQDEK